MQNRVETRVVNSLLKQAQFRNSLKIHPVGNTFKDLSTIVVIPTPGNLQKEEFLNCSKCKHRNKYISTHVNGLNPTFVDAWKRMVRPMNVPWMEVIVSGHEVAEAYNNAVEIILNSPALSKFRFILTVEHDNIIPFIPNTQGPFMLLAECIEKGFDVAGGLYWTKGEVSMPLLYGDPKEKRTSIKGYFKVRNDWKNKPAGPIECNGMGMGFTLFKTSIFKDKRIAKPWFKTVNENTADSIQVYTQDLWFFEKIRSLGYRVCVDTRVRLAHMDLATGKLY